MDLKTIEKDLKAYLDTKGYHLYHVAYDKVENEDVLHIEIDDHLDLNEIAKVSQVISDYLDTKDYIDDQYLLDVATVGIERVLYSFDDVLDHIGEFVYIRFDKAQDGLKEVQGYLKGVDDDMLHVVYRDKNIERSLDVDYKNVRFIRLAIDFKGVKK